MNIREEAAKIAAQMRASQQEASEKFLGWSKEKPKAPGLWFAAKWQNAGYYHVHRFPIDSTVEYLQSQNNDFWSGPYSAEQGKERWIHYLPRPKGIS